MSAIAGIRYWDGRPVHDTELATLSEYGRPAGPDGGGTLTPIPGLAIQAHTRHFDRLSETERQPHVFAQGSVLTWDGRLDNREDLSLSLHRDLGSDLSDAALVAAAYVRWGTSCLQRLIGDWSLAIWDASTQTIVLARDTMGNRLLHYRQAPEGLAWSTRLEALVACFGLYSEPDEGYIAAKLTFGDIPPELTPFRSVRVLRAGHVLEANRCGDVAIRRYWTFSPATIRYRDQGVYDDHLRELLTAGVRARLRAKRTVWSQLSGGWDSSTNVCLANALIDRGCVEAPRLQPLSWVSPASPESDETRYIAAVERWCGLSAIRSEYPGQPTFDELLGHRLPFPRIVTSRLDAAISDAGDHIMLTGLLGDTVMLRSGRMAILEPLQQGHPMRALRLLWARARERRYPVLATLAHLVASSYTPERLKPFTARRREAMRAREKGLPSDVMHRFGVTPSLFARVPQRGRTTYPMASEFPRVKRPYVEAMYAAADHPELPSHDFMPHVWYTCPYAHRPLLEYLVAVPQLTLWDPLVTRAGMKRAFKDVLPVEILERPTKGRPHAAHARDRREQLAKFGENAQVHLGAARDWQLVKREYIDAATLSGVLTTLATDSRYSKRFLKVWLPLEAWLRSLSVAKTATDLGNGVRDATSSSRYVPPRGDDHWAGNSGRGLSPVGRTP